MGAEQLKFLFDYTRRMARRETHQNDPWCLLSKLRTTLLTCTTAYFQKLLE